MSKEKNAAKRTIMVLKHPLPDIHASLKSQFDIISAYVIATGNGQKEVVWRELAPYLKINARIVSGCNKFFQHLGLIKISSKSKKYAPTKLALEMHNARKLKNNELIKSTLQMILYDSWFWIQTKQYLEVNESVRRDELIQKLAISCGADIHKHVRALRVLIEYMLSSDLIKESNGRFELNTNLSIKIENQDAKQAQATELTRQDGFNESNKDVAITHSNPINVSIGLLVNPQMTEEHIRKSVRIILSEIQRISKKDDVDD